MQTLRRRVRGGLTRRDFLGVCSYAPALFLAAPVFEKAASLLAQGTATQAAAALPIVPDYRILPQYRTRSPLEELIRKARRKEDDFPSERYSRKIEGYLARWGNELCKNGDEARTLAGFLSPQFTAASPRPQSLEPIRVDSTLVVRRSSFSSDPSLGRDGFLEQFRSSLNPASKILVAEFKVADLEITSVSPLRVSTEIRYTLVGTGAGLHRLQRIGMWKIDWEQGSGGELLAKNLQPLADVQSLSPQPVFVDITSMALKDVSSYRTQMLRDTDYWRTVLDAATGIDIYGNNGIAAGDYDNDGFDDLYICQTSGLPNRLYHNRGDGTFEDVTEAAGVGVFTIAGTDYIA